MEIENKEKAWLDIYMSNICPKCKEKQMWLDADGDDWQSYICKSCGLEAIVSLERIAESVHLYDEETDTETLLFDNSEINDR